MKETPAKTILKFARSREHAFLETGTATLLRMSAISKIKAVCDFISNHKEEDQKRIIQRQIREEIIYIFPGGDSRFKGLRDKIIKIIYP